MSNPKIAEHGKRTQFKKGHPGLPGAGRPATKVLRDIARMVAEEPDRGKKIAKARVLIDALYKQAAKGSLPHFCHFQRLLEEDAGADVRLSGPDAKPIDIAGLIETMRVIYGLGPNQDGK